MKTNLFPRGELRRLLVDCLVVLIGVLAALVLNNIREDAITNRAARDATERLVHEVQQNAELLRSAREVVARRMSLLEDLDGEIPPGKSVRDLVEQFHGYWLVDLNSSAWDYLSRSALANSVDSQLMQEALALYSHNRSFDRVNDQVQAFLYSELFVSPEKASVGIDVSGTIMWQQLRWVDELLPEYEKFLSRHSSGSESEKN